MKDSQLQDVSWASDNTSTMVEYIWYRSLSSSRFYVPVTPESCECHSVDPHCGQRGFPSAQRAAFMKALGFSGFEK